MTKLTGDEIEYDENYKPEFAHNFLRCNCSYCIQWKKLIKTYGAIVVNQREARRYPNRAIAFETANFGWILSKHNAEGKRRILAQF
jgi:hypothetical protein